LVFISAPSWKPGADVHVLRMIFQLAPLESEEAGV
jgi:hypothetical protein